MTETEKYQRLLAFVKTVSIPEIKSEWLRECHFTTCGNYEVIFARTDLIAQTYESRMMPTRKNLIISAKELLQTIGEK